MQKVALGIGLALLVAVGILAWQLKVAWGDTQKARMEALGAAQALETERGNTEVLLRRLDLIDGALRGLEQGVQESNAKMETNLAVLNGITKTEGDQDESVPCLDVRVPSQLDSSLR